MPGAFRVVEVLNKETQNHEKREIFEPALIAKYPDKNKDIAEKAPEEDFEQGDIEDEGFSISKCCSIYYSHRPFPILCDRPRKKKGSGIAPGPFLLCSVFFSGRLLSEQILAVYLRILLGAFGYFHPHIRLDHPVNKPRAFP